MVLERAFTPERPTYWEIIEVQRGRRSVYIGATLAERTICCEDPAPTFVLSHAAAYATSSEVLNALTSRGFVGWKDFQARSTAVLTLR